MLTDRGADLAHRGEMRSHFGGSKRAGRMGERLLVGFFWKSGNVSKNFCLSVRVSQIFSAIDNVDDEQRETKTLSLSRKPHSCPRCLSLFRARRVPSNPGLPLPLQIQKNKNIKPELKPKAPRIFDQITSQKTRPRWRCTTSSAGTPTGTQTAATSADRYVMFICLCRDS